MKSLLGLGSGGAISAIWGKIPAYVKIPVIFGLGVLAASELTIDANHALQSARIFLGQAAQSEAQAVDPAKTRAAMRTGGPEPVTGAEALLATQVDQGDADAQQKQALAVAATESIDDIRAKAAKHIKLTTTESFRLKEYEIKEQELRAKTAEAQKIEADSRIAAALAAQAEAKARAERIIAESVAGTLTDDRPMDLRRFMGK